MAIICSNDDACLSLFMVTSNDLVCCVSEIELSNILPLLKCYNYKPELVSYDLYSDCLNLGPVRGLGSCVRSHSLMPDDTLRVAGKTTSCLLNHSTVSKHNFLISFALDRSKETACARF